MIATVIDDVERFAALTPQWNELLSHSSADIIATTVAPRARIPAAGGIAGSCFATTYPIRAAATARNSRPYS